MFKRLICIYSRSWCQVSGYRFRNACITKMVGCVTMNASQFCCEPNNRLLLPVWAFNSPALLHLWHPTTRLSRPVAVTAPTGSSISPYLRPRNYQYERHERRVDEVQGSGAARAAPRRTEQIYLRRWFDSLRFCLLVITTGKLPPLTILRILASMR